MKKTATLTFHAPHNYGAMLQAYALQQTILGLGMDNDIINLRIPEQKQFYALPPESGIELKSRIYRGVLGLLFGNYMQNRTKKWDRFEQFLADNLKLTPEISSLVPGIPPATGYDCYITGSDQCWNASCPDFTWAYYLDFITDADKISYASSIGPSAGSVDADKARPLVRDFKAISVRDQDTGKFIESLTGRRHPVLPDPTLLLSRSDWEKMAGDTPLEKGRYIFFYTPYIKPGLYDVADRLSRCLGLPLLISNHTDHRTEAKLRIKGRLRTHLDAGPIEFLNLMRNAAAVITGSYHGLLFSAIFHVPFWAYNGDKDLRMKQILNSHGFDNRAINTGNVAEKAPHTFDIDFAQSDAAIARGREAAVSYLTENCLNSL